MLLRARTFFALTLAVGLATAPSVHAASDPRAIRKVDFRNFTYGVFDGDGRTTTLVNGKFERTDRDNPLYAQVLDVDHGDLDGDGIEEAVVTVVSNTGGTGNFTDGLVFRMIGGKPVMVATLGTGDRADGGIDDVVIVNGVLRVERFGDGSTGACCPNLLERTTFKLVASKLIAQSKPFVRSFIQLGNEDAPQKISFLKGTTEAVIDAVGTSKGFFEAAKGQKVTVSVTAPQGGNMTVTITGPGLKPSTLKPPTTWTKALPATGRYTVALSPTNSDPDLRITLSIK